MPSGEKQLPVSAKKVPSRDFPNETNDFACNPLDYSPLKDRDSTPDTAKLSGSKRKQPSSPCTPHSHQHSISSGHLVYVRRKLDTDPNKLCVEGTEHNDSPYSGNCLKDDSSETNSPGEHVTQLSGAPALLSSASVISSLVSEPPLYSNKPGNLMDISLTDQRSVSPAPLSENQSQNEGYWKERFIRLQMSLKNCDQYNQEKYIQSLRSLSAAGRSLHAVELEKRAIQLLFDEGKELQKMKLLNILGKPLPESYISLSYQAFSPEQLASEK